MGAEPVTSRAAQGAAVAACLAPCRDAATTRVPSSLTSPNSPCCLPTAGARGESWPSWGCTWHGFGAGLEQGHVHPLPALLVACWVPDSWA